MPSLRPFIAKIVTVIVAGAALAGAGAYWQLQKAVSAHPGADALEHFVPQDAAIALTLDIKPNSFEQGQVMLRLNSSLDHEDLKNRISNSLHKLFKDAPFFQDMVPHLTGSGAVAIWSRNGVSYDSSQAAGLLALTIDSTKETETVLKRYAERTITVNGAPVYIVTSVGSSSDRQSMASNNTPGYITIRQNYLLLTDSEESLNRILAIEQHKADNLSKNADYQSLRKSVPAEANLFCYISATAMRETQRQAMQSDSTATALAQRAEPACFSATLRQGGIAFNSVVRCSADFAKPLSAIAPIDQKTALRIPPHALAFSVLSQPGKYLETAEAAVKSVGGEVNASYEKGLLEFERQTLISLHSDIIPAFNGQFIAAAYPGTQKDTLDLLFIADNTHAATPANLADAARNAIERRDPKTQFTKHTEGDTTRWTLPTSWNVNSIGNTENTPDNHERAAQVDNSILFATSKDLLDRAVTAYHGAPVQPLELMRIPGGTKSLVVLQTNEILDMLKPRLEELQKRSNADNPITVSDVSSTFGTAPFIASVGYENGQFNSSLLIPVNYDSVIHLSRKLWDQIDKEQASSDR